MKILVINPNTSQFVTDKVCQVAADAAGSGFEFVGVTGLSGSPIVGTRAECALASKEVMTIAAEHAEGEARGGGERGGEGEKKGGRREKRRKERGRGKKH